MFLDVKQMNEAFGNPEGNPADLRMAVPGGNEKEDWERVDSMWGRLNAQCKNIKAEYEELQEALAERDVDKVRDALCDINVFSLGAHHLMGLDADDDMAEVVAAVLTRFCTDEKHLADTSAYYAMKGVEHYVGGEFPYKFLKSSRDQGKSIAADGSETWEYPKGKFLKAVGSRKPIFA